MPAASPLSTGLFDSHLERAKSHLAGGQAEQAEKELSEAYFLRPRDRKVLGLLGVLYFKQGRLERAEEVFDKLSKETPDDSAVLFNLGLINFKLNRFREAEGAFLQALQFTKDRPRVHFYLGATYEKHGRIREAIHQFRLARAAHSALRSKTSPIDLPPPPTGLTEGIARPKAAVQRSSDSTVDFIPAPTLPAPKAIPIDETNEDEGFFGEAKLVQIPGSELQASGTLRDDVSLSLQPEVLKLGAEEEDVFLGGSAGTPTTTMVLRQRDTIEIPFDGRVFFRRGTLVSSTGHVNFWVKERSGESGDRLVIATGSGSLLLRDGGQSIGLIACEVGRKLWARGEKILAAEDTLQPRYVALANSGGAASVVEMEGSGFAVVAWKELPHCVRVRLDQPLVAKADAIIAWSGAISARAGAAPDVIELRGEGEALVYES